MKGYIMKVLSFACAAALSILGTSAALAGHGDHDDCAYTPRAEWMSAKDIAEKARADGYTVLDIHADDGCWRVKALDKARYRVKITYNPKSGELLWVKHD